MGAGGSIGVVVLESLAGLGAADGVAPEFPVSVFVTDLVIEFRSINGIVS
jgi:hypothetical protein